MSIQLEEKQFLTFFKGLSRNSLILTSASSQFLTSSLKNLFLVLAVRLATDDAKELLPKICSVMKLMFGRISNYHSSLEHCLGWYKQENSQAKAAQVNFSEGACSYWQ